MCFRFLHKISVTLRRMCCNANIILLLLITAIVFFIVDFFETSLRPPKMSLHLQAIDPLFPSAGRLLNLVDFRYIINVDACAKETVFAIVIVHSHPANVAQRDVLRETIPAEDLRELNMRRVFLLARAEWDDQALYPKVPQSDLEAEGLRHSDVIQGNFKEHYHNLTYKHTMGLQWVTQYCPQVSYVIKMDDDIIVDLYQFHDKLKYRYPHRRNLILGLLQLEARPMRAPESKWFVSEQVYPKDFYPPFMSGWAYAMAIDAVKSIVRVAHTIPYFWIDDVHITGTIASLVGVKHEALNGLYTTHVNHLHCCVELARSAEFYCDFMAGPSEGDLQITRKVLNHARFCHINTCVRRDAFQGITRVCVRTYVHEKTPMGKGEGQIIPVMG